MSLKRRIRAVNLTVGLFDNVYVWMVVRYLSVTKERFFIGSRSYYQTDQEDEKKGLESEGLEGVGLESERLESDDLKGLLVVLAYTQKPF
jgi:hypothetical protein